MAAVITTSSSTQPKTNINGAISTSNFTAANTGGIVQDVTLTEIQNAIKKLSTYVTHVNNCGNCITYTTKSTSQCSYTCQSQCRGYRYTTTGYKTITYYNYHSDTCDV